MTIADTTILVTGANRGIGRALVEEALRRGAKRVYAVLTGPTDTEMPRDFDIPKASPESVARAIFDASTTGRRTSSPIPCHGLWLTAGAAARPRRSSARTRPSLHDSPSSHKQREALNWNAAPTCWLGTAPRAPTTVTGASSSRDGHGPRRSGCSLPVVASSHHLLTRERPAPAPAGAAAWRRGPWVIVAAPGGGRIGPGAQPATPARVGRHPPPTPAGRRGWRPGADDSRAASGEHRPAGVATAHHRSGSWRRRSKHGRTEPSPSHPAAPDAPSSPRDCAAITRSPLHALAGSPGRPVDARGRRHGRRPGPACSPQGNRRCGRGDLHPFRRAAQGPEPRCRGVPVIAHDRQGRRSPDVTRSPRPAS
jgi:hypothetical protein